MLLALLTSLLIAASVDEAERWVPGTLGGLQTPWESSVSPSEDLVAVVDGLGKVRLMDAQTGVVRWTVSVVQSKGGAQGMSVFGPDGLAVAVRGDRAQEMRVVILDTADGTIEPLGSAPADSDVVDIRWTEDGRVLTRTRERPSEREMGDQLVERVWGAEPSTRNLGPWTGYPKLKAATAHRVLVDATRYGLEGSRSRRSELQIKPRLEVWDDRWDKETARKLRPCPEWSPTVHISDDGRRAYSQGKVRCTWNLDTGELEAAWEVPEMPWWSALSPDGRRVVERHGKGTKRYGVVRDVATGKWTYQIPDLQSATFTNDHSLLVWTEYRLELRNLADGEVRWSVPLDGEVMEVRMTSDARAILVVERMAEDSGLRVRVLDPNGKPRAVVSDVRKIRSSSMSGRRLLLEVRADHLQVVDLHSDVSPRRPAHLAPVTVLSVDDRGQVASGDAEGHVLLRSPGAEIRSWRRGGKVHDLHVQDGVLTWVSEVAKQEPVKWYLHRTGPAGEGKRAPLLATGADAVLLASGVKRVVALTPTGPTEGPAGKGRHKSLPVWTDKDGGPGPDPDLAIVVPGTSQVLGPSYLRRPRSAGSWGSSKRNPVRTYALPAGIVGAVASDGRLVVVAEATAGGRVFRVQGGGEPVDLAVVDNPGGTCCAGVGGDTVAVATRLGEVHVHSATNGDLEHRLAPGFVAPISRVAVSPNGRWLAVGSDSGEVVLYTVGD